MTRLDSSTTCVLAARGFSMIELMITISIIAILAAIAVPSFSELMAKNRVKATATNLQLAMLRARSEAVKRNAPVIIAPVGSWAGGWQVCAPDCSTAANVLAGEGAPKGVVIETSVATITYASSGRVRGATQPSFEVADKVRSSELRCVAADLSGLPYIRKAACP